MFGSKTAIWFVAGCVCAATSVHAVHAQDTSSSNSLKLDQVSSSSPRKWSGQWKFEIGGASYAEGQDAGAAAYLFFHSDFDFRFNSMLSAHVEPVIGFFSSRLQERYDNDIYDSKIRAAAAYLSFKPISNLDLRGGAVSQAFVDDPLLISKHRAFPGVQEIYTQEIGPDLKIMGMAQQLIPTSYSLNSERTEKESLPTFQTQSLHVEGKLQDEKANWGGFAGHYTWANLPDKVAFDSAQAGNTSINGQVAPGTRLAYEFDGYFWGADGCWCDKSSRFDWLAAYRGIHNAKAPGDSADGQLWMLGTRVKMGERELELKYYNEFMESDATIASYSPSLIGYTNRIGDVIEAKYNLKDQGFAITGQWANARTLADKNTQQTMTQYYLGVETDYAPF